MVCLGNICRSPLAMAILKKKANDQSLNIKVDSAGFEPYHNGDQADKRSVEIAQKHNIDLTSHRARLFRHTDFDNYDKIYVMDYINYVDVKNASRKKEDMEKVDFILNTITPGENVPVPDPYYGGSDGFKKVYDLLDKATDKIIEKIKINDIK